jgi:hypothetical protein
MTQAEREEPMVKWNTMFDALGDEYRHRILVALLELAPDLERRELPPVRTFGDTDGDVATREVAEVYQWSPGKAEQVLNELVAMGDLRSVEKGNGTFWTSPDTEYATRLGTGELALGGELEWDA